MPAKRAATQLFLIESRTAHLMVQSRQAMERFLTEEAAQERELAFVEAFALAREPPLRPTIQDLERYSAHWASLVPENPRLQAAVAHRLGEKYEFAHEAVPGIRAALGLDETTMQQAYEHLYREPIESIYAARTDVPARLRWAWAGLAARLENLPPFWTAYALTLTETVGATILALPIALAEIGPLGGVVVLVVLGLVNVLTVSFLAEAVARSGTMRYGGAFFGRLVADFLGRGGSFVLSVSLFVLCLLVLSIFYIGFSKTLDAATGIPDFAWVALLFLVGIYYLRRQSLNATIASALVVGTVNIGLILLLSILAFLHARADNFLYNEAPFVGGRPFDASLVALVFGVILAAYFGHISVAICGPLVLRRDPSGRSLIWGCAAAQTTAIVFYCLFVLAVNGAVAPERLAGEEGTALSPLAEEVGPAVDVLGSTFVVLGLGMGSITFTLALFNLTRERLPSTAARAITLPRRRARLLLEERGLFGGRDGRLRVGLVYTGLEGGRPRFRLDVERDGRTDRVDAVAEREWNVLGPDGVSERLDRLRDLRDHRARLSLDITEADDQRVRFYVTTTMRLAYEGQWDVAGLSFADVLALRDAEAELVGWIMRSGEVSLSDVVSHAGGDESAARAMLSSLVARGTVGETSSAGELRYAARAGPRRGRLPSEIWQALAYEDAPEKAGQPDDGPPPAFGRSEQVRGLLFGRYGRFPVAASPVLAAFLLAEWLVLTGSGSFAGLLSFVGVIAVSVLAGAFPVLLLISSRRKGEYLPSTVYGLLGSPVLLAAIYLLFLASIFLHGLVIWDDLPQRIGALIAGVIVLGMTAFMARRGAFSPRISVELRDDQEEGSGRFAVMSAGRPATSDVVLEYPDGDERLRTASAEIGRFSLLRRARFQLAPDERESAQASELKVWAHRVTPESGSEGLSGHLEVQLGAERRQFDLGLSRGQVVIRLPQVPGRVDITFGESDGSQQA